MLRGTASDPEREELVDTRCSADTDTGTGGQQGVCPSVCSSLRWSLTLTVCSIPTLYNKYVVIGYIILKRNKI